MHFKQLLVVFYSGVLLCMLAVTGWASWVQPVWEWTGLTSEPNNAWTIATLADTYFAFFTLCFWVIYKEHRVARRAIWVLAFLLLGNIAIAVYLLKELARLEPDESMAQLLIRRNV